MLGDFKKTFKQTKEDKANNVITRLQLIISLIKDKDCCTCKYSKCSAIKDMGNETYITCCVKENYKDTYETCELYEVNEELGRF